MSLPTPEQLLANSAFQGMVAIGHRALAAHAAVVRGTGAEQLRDHQAEGEALLARLRTAMRERSPAPEADLDKLAELLGISPSAVRETTQQVSALGAELGTSFPELLQLGELDRRLLVLNALRIDDATFAAMKMAAIDAVDGAPEEEGACKAACTLAFLLALFGIQINTVSRMMACVGLVFPPLVVLCAAIMIAIMIVEMTKAQREYDECKEECEPAGPGR